MNYRWLRLPFALMMLGMLAGIPAHAQVRTLPQNAQFGQLGAAQDLPNVQISKKIYKLAPGGVIYDQHNRTILQNALPTDVRVAYTLDLLTGDIARIYILTELEIAQQERKK